MNQTMQVVLLLLRRSLWDEPVNLPEGVDNSEIYQEMVSHTVAALADSALLATCQDPSVRRQRHIAFLQQRCWNEQNLYAQSLLLDLLNTAEIPTAILKGAAAAQYYPHPEKRLLGDVDFLVPQECFDEALDLLNKNGYIQTDNASDDSYEVLLYKNGTAFELHRGMNLEERSQADALSHRILKDISLVQPRTVDGFTFPALPDLTNGLVILAHIRQHLNGGLGLRQIVDWMLYAFHFLDDTTWYREFQTEARHFGLETLAITVTRMCQLYLGLPEENRTWCSGADKILCHDLLEYVFNGGNFGRKEPGYKRATRQALMKKEYTWKMVETLQTKGVRRSFVKKHPYTKPFAWCIQLGHYAYETLKRGNVVKILNTDLANAHRLQQLLDALDNTTETQP